MKYFPLRIRVSTYPRIYYRAFLKYVTRSWYPVPMCDVRVSTYPGIHVFHCVSAYPRIRVSTSQYSLKFTWGGVVLSTAYPRFQPFQRCSFKMAGYSAVKPTGNLEYCKYDRDNLLPVRDNFLMLLTARITRKRLASSH